MTALPTSHTIKVNVKGETHNVSFEHPVDSVECLRSNMLRNVLSFLLFIAVITIFYLANKNTELKSEIYKIEHSRQRHARILKSEGIAWDKSTKKFTQVVTKMSPDELMLDK